MCRYFPPNPVGEVGSVEWTSPQFRQRWLRVPPALDAGDFLVRQIPEIGGAICGGAIFGGFAAGGVGGVDQPSPAVLLLGSIEALG